MIGKYIFLSAKDWLIIALHYIQIIAAHCSAFYFELWSDFDVEMLILKLFIFCLICCDKWRYAAQIMCMYGKGAERTDIFL